MKDNPDSFDRQLQAELLHARRLGRVPTVDEALDHVHDNDLFTGDWEENYTKRRGRLGWIVGHIAKTYDPSRRGTGRRPVEQDVPGWTRQAEAEYPEGLTCNTLPRGYTKLGGIPEKTRLVYVSPQRLGVIMAAIHFALRTDPNPDGSIPCNRLRHLIPNYCHDEIKLVRDTLVRDGYLQCDYTKGPGRAFRFKPGILYPSFAPSTQREAERGPIIFIRHESFPRPQDAFLAAELAVQAPVQAPERPP